MRQTIDSAFSVARGMWRYRWQAVAAGWGTALAGWLIVCFIYVPQYTARAQIYVDTETVLRPLLKGLTLDINPSEQLGLMARQMMSRPNLEHVVRDTGLERQDRSSQPLGVALENLRANITLKAERTSSDARYTNYYVLSYTNVDSELAKKVVESLINAFEKNTLADIRQDAVRAKRFLDMRIEEHKERLAASELRLRQYKRQHVDVLPQGGRAYFERLTSERSVLAEIELEIRQTGSRLDKIRAQLDSTPAEIRAISRDGEPIQSPVESRYLTLQAKLDQLLLKFTDLHPDVVETRSIIAELEKQRAAAGVSGPTISNPLYRQLLLKSKEVEAVLAGLRTKRQAYFSRVEALQRQIETLPAIEDELLRITQDHEINQENFTTLVARRQSMTMSENVEQNSEDLRFRVIEPPNVPVDSTLDSFWRKQLGLLTGVLLVGLTAGLALPYTFSQIRPTVSSRHVLSEVTGLPVYGMITRVATSPVSLWRRMELTAFAATILMIMVAYLIVLTVQFSNTYHGGAPLVSVIQRLLESGG